MDFFNEVTNWSPSFRLIFMDTIKYKNSEARLKSRLVTLTYGVEEAARISTKKTTVQRFTKRLVLALAASVEDMMVNTRDVTEAFIQATTLLERNVFIGTRSEMRLSGKKVLKLVKSLYKTRECALHWYPAYIERHLHKRSSQQLRIDPYFCKNQKVTPWQLCFCYE